MKRAFVVLNPEKPIYPDTWWQKHAVPDSDQPYVAFFVEAHEHHPDMAASKEGQRNAQRRVVDDPRRKSA